MLTAKWRSKGVCENGNSANAEALNVSLKLKYAYYYTHYVIY